jgi:hypothetical protein
VDLFLQYLFSSFLWQGALIAVQIAVVSFVARCCSACCSR